MNLYLIAGPPGIGKSTSAGEFIPAGVPIVDQDLAAYQYKKQGFADYRDIASLSTRERIRRHLFAGEDFALELNLGFASHYEYLNSLVSFDRTNSVHLLLFFTDDLSLCLSRAKIRHLSGGHEVKPEIVQEMYDNTLPLFKQHEKLFSSVRLLDVTDTLIHEPLQSDKVLTHWIADNGLERFLPVSSLPPRTRGPRPG